MSFRASLSKTNSPSFLSWLITSLLIFLIEYGVFRNSGCSVKFSICFLNDAPEHLGFGKIQNQLLKILDIPFKIISENEWKSICDWSLNNLHKNNSCALIIKREHE